MDGLLVLDKPSGPTSHDVVARMRRVLGEKRIGHTGTLDPLATGVLLLVVGKATRLARFLSASDKTYEAEVRFGFATDTADADGRPSGPVSEQPPPGREAIEAALDAFRGTFFQQPPAFSAKKIAGQRSYHLARTLRRGRESFSLSATALPDSPLASTQKVKMTPDPCQVTSHAVTVIRLDDDRLTLHVDCSAGFYIRSLAHDLGERLRVGAHLTALRRTRTGDFGLDHAIALDTAERDPRAAAAALVPLSGILPAWPSLVLTADGVSRVTHGQDIRPADHGPTVGSAPADLDAPRFVRLLDPAGHLLAVAQPTADGRALHPSVVLV